MREAARQASVANFGAIATCTTFTSGSTNMRKLACLTKARSDLTAATPAIAIRFDPGSTSYPAGTGVPPVGNGIVVCAITRFGSVSGAYSA
ncbi:MAG TPA: hypothetical protein PLK97_06825, partial [Pseudomonadales bacterium]|nr:hypothetical protein [Pseudomonadales bacterium]